MSSEEGFLRRSRSLLKRRATAKERQPPGCIGEGEYEAVNLRPAKQTPILLTHIVTHPSTKPPTNHSTDSSTQPTGPVELPSPIQLHRTTWPALPKDPKPGSHSFDHAPTLTRTPWELSRQRRQPRWSTGSRTLPARIFETLPEGIYECVVRHVASSHTSGLRIDVVSTQRELSNLCLISRRWARVATECLYGKLWLPSGKAIGRRKFSLSMGRARSRLDLLLRTLAEAPPLAALVREVWVFRELRGELEAEIARGQGSWMGWEGVLAVVEMCGEVEIVGGFVPGLETGEGRRYEEMTDRWFDVLSSRAKLKSHIWTLNLDRPPWNSLTRFIDAHTNWQHLETLVFHSTGSESGKWQGVISALVTRLPSLTNLAVISLPPSAFHNGTLLALPPLISLRLDNLSGITDQGLQKFATTPPAALLHSLSLSNLELTSLKTLQTLLAYLPHLSRFRLIQTCSPTPLPGLNPSNPRLLLASKSLAYLHWDPLIPGPATDILAASLRAGKLPALRILKSPSDYDGALQSLCRPIPARPFSTSDLLLLQSADTEHYVRDLRVSTLQARLRAREHRRLPGGSRGTGGVEVVIEDEDSGERERRVYGRFLGDLGSRVKYEIGSEVEGGREGGAGLGDLIDRDLGEGAGEKRVSMDVLF